VTKSKVLTGKKIGLVPKIVITFIGRFTFVTPSLPIFSNSAA